MYPDSYLASGLTSDRREEDGLAPKTDRYRLVRLRRRWWLSEPGFTMIREDLPGFYLVSGLTSDWREEGGPDAAVGSLDPDSIVGNLGTWRQFGPLPIMWDSAVVADCLNQDVQVSERIYQDSLMGVTSRLW